MSRLSLIYRIIKNDRMKEYDSIIKMAKANDYELIGLRHYISSQNRNRKTVILRHDVDTLCDGTRMMFDIEKKNGVFSSFYFRNETFDPVLMKEIEQYGSEASLHFESIAEFIRINRIKSKEELLTINFSERCLKLLKNNIERYRLLLDIPCITIASHGAVENRKFGIPNNILTEDADVYSVLGIKMEAYNKELIDNVCYISDTTLEKNNGYRYQDTPMSAIGSERKLIIFLTHPNHWKYNKKTKIKKLIKAIIGRIDNSIDVFKRI